MRNMQTKSPNLLIVHAHDMGRYNSAYGFALPTPNMARLASQGLTLRNAHCAAPTCSPSRAAMFTGLTAHQMGMLGLTHRGFTLNDYSLHLARRLSAEGYLTVQTGLQHEYHPREDDPIYERVIPNTEGALEKRDLNSADNAAAFLREGSERPWFLWMGLFLPHRPFVAADPDRFPEHAVKVPDPLPDSARNRADMAAYMASVHIADQALGRVLDALEASGQADNTLVILTTDHGIAFPDMKCNLTAHGTGVTWLLRLPGVIPAGRASDALVSHLDLVPTVFDVLGLPLPSSLPGRSLRPVFADPAGARIREDLFAEVNVHAAVGPARALRTATASYIRIFEKDLSQNLANCDESPSRDEWLDAGWATRPREAVQLYDLVFDPQERRNLAHDPRYAALRAEMEARLQAWMENTHDPLLQGPLRVPAGSLINRRDAFSPSPDVLKLSEDLLVPG